MEEAPKARKKEIMRVTLLGSFANFVLLVFKFRQPHSPDIQVRGGYLGA